MAMTKEERAAYMRKWRAEHREQINANRRYNYEHNPEIKEKEKAWYKAYYERHKNDPEYKAKMRENNKRWRENNRDYRNAYHKRWRENNRDYRNAYHKRWRENNRDYWNAYYRDYRLRKAERE